MTRRGETLESDALAACASEPIQHSGAIQPHRCLLSCGIDDLVIRTSPPIPQTCLTCLPRS